MYWIFTTNNVNIKKLARDELYVNCKLNVFVVTKFSAPHVKPFTGINAPYILSSINVLFYVYKVDQKILSYFWKPIISSKYVTVSTS